MYILKIIALSLSSLLVLFILTKIIGNKEMSQLTMFDYIVSITIGSIAAEMSTSLEDNFWEPVIAMIIYGLTTVIISIVACHSSKFRRITNGKTLILFDNAKFYIDNFTKAKLDINEFLMQCRVNGYFKLSDIQTAVLEANGKISFLPNSLKRPSTPEDLNISPIQETILTNVILDGFVLNKNLKSTGNDLTWLNNELTNQGIYQIDDIFLATCDSNNNLSVYRKFKKKDHNDIFE